MSDTGFRIGDTFYPMPDNYTLGDSVLIRQVGGMDMEEFAEALQDVEQGLTDPRVLAGLIGVAVWRQNPSWNVTRAARYVQQINLEELAFEDGEEESVPLPEAAGEDVDKSLPAPGSPEPVETSSSEPNFDSDEQTPTLYGVPA